MRKKISGAGAAAFTSFFSDFMTAIMQFLFRRRRQSVTSVSFSFKRADKSKVNPYCWKMSSHFLFTTSKEIEKLKVLQRQKQCKNWLGETPSCVSTAQSFLLMCHSSNSWSSSFFVPCHSPNPGPEMHRIFKLILHCMSCNVAFSFLIVLKWDRFPCAFLLKGSYILDAVRSFFGLFHPSRPSCRESFEYRRGVMKHVQHFNQMTVDCYIVDVV